MAFSTILDRIPLVALQRYVMILIKTGQRMKVDVHASSTPFTELFYDKIAPVSKCVSFFGSVILSFYYSDHELVLRFVLVHNKHSVWTIRTLLGDG